MSAFAVFIEGLLSFFSPCVLPLLPMYIGYLAGEDASENAGSRLKTIARMCFFILGIGTSFFILGLGLTGAGMLLRRYRTYFAAAGGIMIILLGLYQLGLFGKIRVVETEHRLPFRLRKMRMSPLTAYLTGLLFSFAWTPCVGPMLSSVLLMAGAASSRETGFLLVALYTLGFALPFLLAGIFTTSLLSLFKKHRGVVRYTAKIGGVIMIVMGILMVSGRMDILTARLAAAEESAVQSEAGAAAGVDTAVAEAGENAEETEEAAGTEAEDTAEATLYPAPDFTLQDQYGQEHTLSDYQGKVVFLNFWATWCPPCRAEMPDIEKLYQEYAAQDDPEVIILGVASPNVGQEGSTEDIAAFLSENGYTYPVVMDTDGALLRTYGISAFPTTFMIDRDGNLFGYVAGSLPEESMRDIIAQTLEGRG